MIVEGIPCRQTVFGLARKLSLAVKSDWTFPVRVCGFRWLSTVVASVAKIRIPLDMLRLFMIQRALAE